MVENLEFLLMTGVLWRVQKKMIKMQTKQKGIDKIFFLRTSGGFILPQATNLF